MLDGRLALLFMAIGFVFYWLGYYNAREDAKRESKATERKKFDTMRSMNYTKRGR